MDVINRILRRRAALKRQFDVAESFKALEESCIPSYLHPNPAAAAVAWWRLAVAAQLYRRHAPAGPILDFGAASGELYHMLETSEDYSFIESNRVLARSLKTMAPRANEETLVSLPERAYAAVFALDALEHNEDVGPLLDRLVSSIRCRGVLIISGPTENALYRLGRRIAGFGGGYHKTTISKIEQLAATRLTLVQRRSVPFGLPLFSLSVWRHSGTTPAPGATRGAERSAYRS